MSCKVSPAISLEARLSRWPPLCFFLISAIFHYLGPAFAVVLFQRVAPLGVAWLRIATAAAVFALFRKPWRVLLALNRRDQGRLIAFGVVLAAMNSCFYLSISGTAFEHCGRHRISRSDYPRCFPIPNRSQFCQSRSGGSRRLFPYPYRD